MILQTSVSVLPVYLLLIILTGLRHKVAILLVKNQACILHSTKYCIKPKSFHECMCLYSIVLRFLQMISFSIISREKIKLQLMIYLCSFSFVYQLLSKAFWQLHNEIEK